MAKRKKARCGRGWATLEIRRNGRVERVCARFVQPRTRAKASSYGWWWLPLEAAAALGRKTRTK